MEEEDEVDDERLERLDEEIVRIEKAEGETIAACANCGSTNLTVPPVTIDAIGVTSATLDGRVYCMDCGFEGLPIIFDKEDEYRRFHEFRQMKLKEAATMIPSNPASHSFRSKKNQGLAAFLSAYFFYLIPGVGQMYNKQPGKALLFVALILLILYLGIVYPDYAFTVFFIPIIYLMCVLDAYMNARR